MSFCKSLMALAGCCLGNWDIVEVYRPAINEDIEKIYTTNVDHRLYG